MKKLKRQLSVAGIIITATVFFALPQFSMAQATYKLTPGKDVNIKVLGSSNVHDWTETSGTIESQGSFKVGDDGRLVSLSSFSLSLNAKSLKSEHEMMDSRTYKAIKADQYPKITFQLVSATVTPLEKNKAAIKATGDLTIAGTTQSIILDVTAIVNPDNSITCTGAKKLKLTDYKIEPPSYLLGAMKVANELTIQFNLLFTKNN